MTKLTLLSASVCWALMAPASAFTSPVSTKPSTFHRTSSSALGMLSEYEPEEDDEKYQASRNILNMAGTEMIEDPQATRERLEREERIRQRFVDYGDELWDLREQIEQLTSELEQAIKSGSFREEATLRAELREVEKRDPEIVYENELGLFRKASLEARDEDALKHYQLAQDARSCLPQFNLGGLWVGKYGSHGYEMINVTYTGDTLIAYKATGDKNVPRGEITFQVDLTPRLAKSLPSETNDSSKEKHTRKRRQQPESNVLKPISLTEAASKKWGTKQLIRYAGKGQVAQEGFQNRQWMNGQLIIIGQEYFSFAWLPIEHQIFFGRPSQELVVKMLREKGGIKYRAAEPFDEPPDETESLDVLRAYAARCMKATYIEFAGARDAGAVWLQTEDVELSENVFQ
mmetsp:Transcript_21737/g.33168  ORF Transcript_21737/g.33168 Transcript_21737/m.33168 type:complete len:403 (-) Transcript_21737:190-1398(-)|eukprot:CAMPEP_0118679852 /NCGR_PEP_ID=MMETSP0800-20121206/4018_1 /TAXON_ID=210618 ORGANISM="Striatella unipunctata, Strain CCMP2910" /NCGR_SAMPLE_ID=MMETSP0800 /ASSEMBLY_ACC=CAM_ASM_000638 /LENGTH=402 /DNA_ID=CAMNT_0006575893 /DNA_START=48 /DNA_END=1256 /DNA_ORIENTATION=+